MKASFSAIPAGLARALSVSAAVALVGLAVGAARPAWAGTITIVTSFPKDLTQVYKTAFEKQNPDIKVELMRDNGLNDIVAERFDAGVRMGEQLDRDMISARIGPDIRFALVAAPQYFAAHPPPAHPSDLTAHLCINERMQASGGFWAWEFEEQGREIRVRVEGQVAVNNCFDAIEAALSGLGLAYVPEDTVAGPLADGRLARVLEDFTPPWDGYYLYYPSRRQSSPAFTALLDAVRHRA